MTVGWIPKSCPRCGGDCYREEDRGEAFLVCLQCGRRTSNGRVKAAVKLIPACVFPDPIEMTAYFRARYTSIQECYYNLHMVSDTIAAVLDCSRRTVWRGVERGRERGRRSAIRELAAV